MGKLNLGKVQLTPVQVLEFIVLGIKNEQYQAAIDIANDCIDQLKEQEKEKSNGTEVNDHGQTEERSAT